MATAKLKVDFGSVMQTAMKSNLPNLAYLDNLQPMAGGHNIEIHTIVQTSSSIVNPTLQTALQRIIGGVVFNNADGTESSSLKIVPHPDVESVAVIQGTLATGTYVIVVFGIGTIAARATDATNPTASIVSPATSEVTGTVTIIVTAADNVAIDRVELKRDSTILTTFTSLSAKPLSYDWDTTLESDAAYSITAVAYDIAGNTVTSTAVVLTVNNIP